MKYLINDSHDAYFNIAMDTWMLRNLKQAEPIFRLWQNDRSIIVGKNQNTFAEINQEYVDEHDIKVVRRMTGGGAVYHDLQNINFTFIVPVADPSKVNFKEFVQPMVDALHDIGVPAEINGRNDLLLDGKKISGNAQRYERGYLIHHGTLMFDVDVETMVRSLNVADEKFISKAAKSVRSRVGNIKAFAGQNSVLDFLAVVQTRLADGDSELVLDASQLAEIEQLRDEQFSQWAWNYGQSPEFTYNKHERFDAGTIELHANVEAGIIQAIRFTGDYLGWEDIADFEAYFIGQPFTKQAVEDVLAKVSVTNYFGEKVTANNIISLFES
ncbi:MAG: lipoate--protein ligase [Lactobacillaceae bacterium]|jgi:lipoate-protein ligase A|nr:lipoate--protein ligase [Lactobacillaceae bacterium]